MKSFKEFAENVKKIATSEIVLQELKVLEDEQDIKEKQIQSLKQQLAESENVFEDFYNGVDGINSLYKKIDEYKSKYKVGGE